MTMFKCGLKKEVKEKLVFDGAYLKDLDALIKRSIELNNVIYERHQERRFNRRGRKGKGGYSERSKFRSQPQLNRRRELQGYYGPALMEIDSANKKWKPKVKE